MRDWFFESLIEFVNWLLEQAASAANTLLTPINEALPDLSAEVGVVYQYCGIANEWVALDYGMILLLAWFVIVPGILGIKWILGLIPTIN